MNMPDPREHHCHCGAWGAFGYDAADGTRKWYCAEHRPTQWVLRPTRKMEGVPARFAVPCEFCKGELDIRQPGSFQWTSGWVMNREGGGGHGISLPERSARWAHRQCVEKAAKGHVGQSSLFNGR